MKIIKEINDDLLKRKRIVYEFEHLKSSTPKKEDVKKDIADKMKVDEKLVNVKYIKSRFGHGTSRVIAYIYNDQQFYDDVEVIKKKPKVKKDAKETKAKK